MVYESIVKQLADNLSPGRFQHSVRVSSMAEELAETFGCDKQKARLAGLLHDIAREVPEKELLLKAQALGITVDTIEREEPLLLHAPVAAKLAESQFHIADQEVLQAILLHTTGGRHMSLLAKVIYMADLIEPGRSFSGLEEIRELARQDLDQAMLMALNQSISYLLRQRGLIHPDTIEARNELLIAAGKKVRIEKED